MIRVFVAAEFRSFVRFCRPRRTESTTTAVVRTCPCRPTLGYPAQLNAARLMAARRGKDIGGADTAGTGQLRGTTAGTGVILIVGTAG